MLIGARANVCGVLGAAQLRRASFERQLVSTELGPALLRVAPTNSSSARRKVLGRRSRPRGTHRWSCSRGQSFALLLSCARAINAQDPEHRLPPEMELTETVSTGRY